MLKNMCLFLGLFIGAITTNVSAQNNSTDAKAAYLLAEECYGKGDYKCALDFLQQVKTNLGSTNCKILYLQIMATKELYAKDLHIADKVMPLISEFEKSPDYPDFNEEKTLEISKIKLMIRADQKAMAERAKEKEVDDKAAVEAYFYQALNSAGDFGITIDELDKRKPTWKINGWKKKDLQNIQVYYDAFLFSPDAEDFPFIARRRPISSSNPISGILVSDNKIIGYIIQIQDFDEDKSVQSAAYEIMKNSCTYLMATYGKGLGANYRTDHFKAMGNTATINDWRKGDCGVKMASIIFPKGKAGVAKLVQILYCDPAKKLDELMK